MANAGLSTLICESSWVLRPEILTCKAFYESASWKPREAQVWVVMEHIITFSVGDLTSICDFNLGTTQCTPGEWSYRWASRWQEGPQWSGRPTSSRFKLPKPLVHFQRKLIESEESLRDFSFLLFSAVCCRTPGAFTHSVRLKHTGVGI